MTDEIKTCDCKEKCLKKVKEFTFIAGAVFVGATLAILLSASLLKPQQPPQMMQPPIRMERPAPQFHHARPDQRGEFKGGPQRIGHEQRIGQEGQPQPAPHGMKIDQQAPKAEQKK
jgi:hypothetical protein